MEKLTRTEFKKLVEKDPFNLTGGRSQRNTPRLYYNCGGFALGTFNWVTPYISTPILCYDPNDYIGQYTDNARFSYIEESYEDGVPNEEITAKVLEQDVDFLLKHYPFLQKVNYEDCSPNDTIIAYRIFIQLDEDGEIDTDFHFRLRHCGFWFEKSGFEQATVSLYDLFEPWPLADEEDEYYNSEIIFFKINKEQLNGKERQS